MAIKMKINQQNKATKASEILLHLKGVCAGTIGFKSHLELREQFGHRTPTTSVNELRKEGWLIRSSVRPRVSAAVGTEVDYRLLSLIKGAPDEQSKYCSVVDILSSMSYGTNVTSIATRIDLIYKATRDETYARWTSKRLRAQRKIYEYVSNKGHTKVIDYIDFDKNGWYACVDGQVQRVDKSFLK